jgi:ribosomal protein S11
MIQKVDLIKNLFIYGDIKYFSDYKDKLIKHYIKCLLFIRKICLIPVSKSITFNKSNLISNSFKRRLRARVFLTKESVFKRLKGIDIFLITKVGKNLFISWLDVFGRLKTTKSLMTLKDPKRNITKKQKSFSTYFLLRKFGSTLRKRFRLYDISVLIKGSLGVRRKKSFISGLLHSGLKVRSIIDITNVPFNGCRLKKKKRR